MASAAGTTGTTDTASSHDHDIDDQQEVDGQCVDNVLLVVSHGVSDVHPFDLHRDRGADHSRHRRRAELQAREVEALKTLPATHILLYTTAEQLQRRIEELQPTYVHLTGSLADIKPSGEQIELPHLKPKVSRQVLAAAADKGKLVCGDDGHPALELVLPHHAQPVRVAIDNLVDLLRPAIRLHDQSIMGAGRLARILDTAPVRGVVLHCHGGFLLGCFLVHRLNLSFAIAPNTHTAGTSDVHVDVIVSSWKRTLGVEKGVEKLPLGKSLGKANLLAELPPFRYIEPVVHIAGSGTGSQPKEHKTGAQKRKPTAGRQQRRGLHRTQPVDEPHATPDSPAQPPAAGLETPGTPHLFTVAVRVCVVVGMWLSDFA
eukprot:m.86640 g.86640  ORF g.86640 m.86640 type:complete len:373 (-) comp14884_c0_seq2:34-1152(-)